jgi:hypothetical protein
MSSPLNKNFPRVGTSNPVNIFTVVLFPDPLGPKQRNTCPGASENVFQLRRSCNSR